MQLNASTINARSVNGAARFAVHAAADAIAEFGAELDGVRTQHLAGEAVAHFDAAFLASATRFAGAELGVVVDAVLAQTVARSGRGDAAIAVAADLYYTRTLYGYGSAEISLVMFAEVGVVFIDGEGDLRPLVIEADIARVQLGGGSGEISISGELDASAIRRAGMSANPIAVDGALEASHLYDGVRYVGGYGDAAFDVAIEDAGMLRQAHIGSVDFSIDAASEWRVERPTLAGEAPTVLLAQGDFHVRKFFAGAVLMAVSGELDASVFVRGDGGAAIVVAAAATGYKTTHVALEGQAAWIEAALGGRLVKAINGDAALSLAVESNGWRRAKPIDGSAVIEVLGSSTGYINTQAEDDAEQAFTRPQVQREFARPAAQRDWIRT